MLAHNSIDLSIVLVTVLSCALTAISRFSVGIFNALGRHAIYYKSVNKTRPYEYKYQGVLLIKSYISLTSTVILFFSAVPMYHMQLPGFINGIKQNFSI